MKQKSSIWRNLTIVLAALASSQASAAETEQIYNGSFSEGSSSWFSYGTSSSSFADGRMCLAVPGGLTNVWDAALGQNNVPLISGAAYKFSFTASANSSTSMQVNVQLGDTPYTSYLSRSVELTESPQQFSFSFVGAETTKIGQVAFQLGGRSSDATICVDDVSLIGGDPAPQYVPDTGSRVRVNQVGYLPNGPKKATLVTSSTDPLSWDLKTFSGTVVASGQTIPRGVDTASGQNLHAIDFSAFKSEGTGYTLICDGQTSYPFDISKDVFKQLFSDAMQFFYIQRSGIAIDGQLVGSQYARPAGHLGVAPNQGDIDVPCQAGVCDYRLDVRGGWYDAGDEGKYVVNGGITTHQLLSAFERTKTAPTARAGAALGDNSLRVPEQKNGVPDVLDEARWELEFMLRMQVPAGKPLAGMVHHKIHDANWTGIPMAPQDDPQPRELHPPSTAATLNLAATAAKCGRLFPSYDKAFANRCLAAARVAYDAASANPAVYASSTDTSGGGAYEDSDVSDEFYWAAAELYLTTGEQRYLNDLTASKHHTGDVFAPNAFSWQSTAALGRLDLATVPSGLPAAEQTRIRQSVVKAADNYISIGKSEGYGLLFPYWGYYWGSNGNIINNAIVVATAFDISGDPLYRSAAIEGMDYIFGRNALNQSYVTGWGEKNSHNQHSRIFANEANQAYPNPPAGSVAGGANVSLDDPFAKKLVGGCKPQFCYVDDYESYSTNEVAINWNSALAWTAAFLDDQGKFEAKAPISCQVSYTTHGSWPSGFTTNIVVTNTGSKEINNWRLQFAFLGDQKVGHSWSADVKQSGATVSAKNLLHNAKVAPGKSISFGFNGTTEGGPNPVPGLFLLNGVACK